MSTVLTIFLEDPGIFIGLAFVLAATWFLPSKVRWYVFTAGIAVVAFRGYQIYWARKRMKELDRQRELLKGELNSLRNRHQELQDKNKELNEEFVAIKNERNKLLNERKALEGTEEQIQAKKEELDKKLEAKDAEFEANRKRSSSVSDFLGSFSQTEDQLSDNTID